MVVPSLLRVGSRVGCSVHPVGGPEERNPPFHEAERQSGLQSPVLVRANSVRTHHGARGTTRLSGNPKRGCARRSALPSNLRRNPTSRWHWVEPTTG